MVEIIRHFLLRDLTRTAEADSQGRGERAAPHPAVGNTGGKACVCVCEREREREIGWTERWVQEWVEVCVCV